MQADYQPWSLKRFQLWLDLWIHEEAPGEQLRWSVYSWVQSRLEDPYVGARREPDLDDGWSAIVPGSDHGTGSREQAVVVTYTVNERERVIRCELIVSLGKPIL